MPQSLLYLGVRLAANRTHACAPIIQNPFLVNPIFSSFLPLSFFLKKDHIYIYIGNVVISVNPFRNLPDFYDDAAIERYRGRCV